MIPFLKAAIFSIRFFTPLNEERASIAFSGVIPTCLAAHIAANALVALWWPIRFQLSKPCFLF